MALSKEEIASRYGSALLGFAQDNNCLEQMHEETNALQAAIKENPSFITLLSDPVLRLNEKEQVLAQVSELFSPQMQEFLKLVLSYGRFKELPAILANFELRYERQQKVWRGEVTSAVKLTAEQLAGISAAYSKKYGLQGLKLTNKVDPDILGGVILKVDDRLIDGSIRTTLKKIRAHLTINE